MRRFGKMQGKTDAKCITTSNMQGESDYVMNFASYAASKEEIIDNSGLMLLRILRASGVKKVNIAGMDGYSTKMENDYFDKQLEYDFSKEAKRRNVLIQEELSEINKTVEIKFITPTQYEIK